MVGKGANSDFPRDLPLERRLVGGRYRIEGLLGRGSMGAVYRARHALTDNTVALKCILPDAPYSDIIMARFRREVSISAHVPHDGIVKVFDAGQEDDGTLYLAMELLDGETLQQRAQKPGFTPGYGINVIRAMLEPLAAVHAAGIVHRDIKPENIFLHRRPDGRDQVKLLDFGIAKDPRHQSTTRSDVGIGTPYYMSPEQATNARSVTGSSDVWAVGVTLYWLMAGVLPFRGDTPFNTLTLACSNPHPPLNVEGGEITQRLVALIDRTLNKDADQRPQDASSLLTAMNMILGPLGPADSLSAVSYGSNPHLVAPWQAPLPAAHSTSGVVSAPLTREAAMQTATALSPAAAIPWRYAAATGLVLAVGIGVGAALSGGTNNDISSVPLPRPPGRSDLPASSVKTAIKTPPVAETPRPTAVTPKPNPASARTRSAVRLKSSAARRVAPRRDGVKPNPRAGIDVPVNAPRPGRSPAVAERDSVTAPSAPGKTPEVKRAVNASAPSHAVTPPPNPVVSAPSDATTADVADSSRAFGRSTDAGVIETSTQGSAVTAAPNRPTPSADAAAKAPAPRAPAKQKMKQKQKRKKKEQRFLTF